MSTQAASERGTLPSAFSLFKPSWEAFRVNLDAFVQQILIVLGLMIVSSLLMRVGADNTAFQLLGLAVLAVAIVAGIYLNAMITLTVYKSVQNQKTSLREMFTEAQQYVWRLLGLGLLTGLLVVVGLILFIFPGLFALQRLLLSPYFLIEKNLGVIEAMKASAGVAKANSGAIWGIVGVLIIIAISQFAPLVGWIAYFVLSIAYLCAPAVRFFEIKRHGKKAAEPKAKPQEVATAATKTAKSESTEEDDKK